MSTLDYMYKRVYGILRFWMQLRLTCPRLLIGYGMYYCSIYFFFLKSLFLHLALLKPLLISRLFHYSLSAMVLIKILFYLLPFYYFPLTLHSCYSSPTHSFADNSTSKVASQLQLFNSILADLDEVSGRVSSILTLSKILVQIYHSTSLLILMIIESNLWTK